MTIRLDLLSLFCGAGGLDLGFKYYKEIKKLYETKNKIRNLFTVSPVNKKYEFDIVWANDVFKEAWQTYINNIGSHCTCEDIRKIDFDDVPDCDGILGGPPCVSFSVLSKREGIENENGQLYKNYVQALKKKQPLFFVMENVKGLLSANNGRAIELIAKDFRQCNYRIFPNVYDFADYGVPQHRERLIIVGFRSDLDIEFVPPTPTHRGNHVSSGEALYGVEEVPYNNEHSRILERTRRIINAIPEGGNYQDLPKELYVKGLMSNIYRRLDRNKPSTTVIANGGGGTWGYHYEEPRPLTNRERARLQTFPDDFVFTGTISKVRKQIGNAVPPLGAAHIAEAVVQSIINKINSTPKEELHKDLLKFV